MPTLALEKELGGVVAGIDEVGIGPWAGPVVAAAVIFHKPPVPRGIQDSKKMSRDNRESLYDTIRARALVGVGIASVEEIDRLNVLYASHLAMKRALEALGIIPDAVLVDGNKSPEFPCRSQSVVGGDGLSLSIAAASIVAKVTRDRMMGELAALFPDYKWDRNAGYGTRDHQEALRRLGPCEHHRRSFAPIRALIEAERVSA